MHIFMYVDCKQLENKNKFYILTSEKSPSIFSSTPCTHLK